MTAPRDDIVWFYWNFPIDPPETAAEAALGQMADKAGYEHDQHGFQTGSSDGKRQYSIYCPERQALAFFERLVTAGMVPEGIEMPPPEESEGYPSHYADLYDLCAEQHARFDVCPI